MNPFLRASSARPHTAFTLLELVVVISIIGALAALLLPVFSKGKDSAIRTVDINNLRQFMESTHLYAADNRDAMPWSNWYSGDAPDRTGWLYTIDGSATGTNRFRAQTGAFWRRPSFTGVPRISRLTCCSTCASSRSPVMS